METLEIATFRTVAGTTEAEVMAAAGAMMPWLERQPGFRSRILTAGAGGLWTDLVVWSDRKAAEAAMQAAAGAAEVAPFFALIDGASVGMEHRPVRLRAVA